MPEPHTTRELIAAANRVPAGGYPLVHVVVVGRAEPSSQVEHEDSGEEGQGQSL